MKNYAQQYTLGMFVLLTTLGAQAQATPLESLHSNSRWLERPGTIAVSLYSDWDHKLIETTTCDGKLNSAYTLNGELHNNDNAYFVMEVVDHCKTKSFREFGPFENHLISPYAGLLYGSMDADLTQIAASTDGTYHDDFLAHNLYTATSSSITLSERVMDGTLIANYKIERVGDQIIFNYDTILPSGHLETHVAGAFSATTILPPETDSTSDTATP